MFVKILLVCYVMRLIVGKGLSIILVNEKFSVGYLLFLYLGGNSLKKVILIKCVLMLI